MPSSVVGSVTDTVPEVPIGLHDVDHLRDVPKRVRAVDRYSADEGVDEASGRGGLLELRVALRPLMSFELWVVSLEPAAPR